MTRLNLIREVKITDGREVRTGLVFRDAATGTYFFTDDNDRFLDGLERIADDSDYSIVDLFRDAGSPFEICGDE